MSVMTDFSVIPVPRPAMGGGSAYSGAGGKRESSNLNYVSWIPDQVRNDKLYFKLLDSPDPGRGNDRISLSF